jgi:tight adherence protein C
MLYVAMFFSVTLLVIAFVSLAQEKRQTVQRRIALATGGEALTSIDDEPEEGKSKRHKLSQLVRPLWTIWKRAFTRRLSEEKAARLELALLRAGKPLGMGPAEYRLVQLCLLTCAPVLCGIYGYLLTGSMGGVLLLGLVGLAAALLLPRYYLSLRSKQRSHKALRELPDALDLLTVSLEAGLGFDAALSKLVAKSEGILSSEFQRCLEEIRLGRTRREALTGVRDRIDLDEIKVLISSILQAERLGIGMVQVLRVQSQEVREQRKQRAEEEAMKAPIKMLFPLVLFIFPSLFIVLLGPAVIQFLETFSK